MPRPIASVTVKPRIKHTLDKGLSVSVHFPGTFLRASIELSPRMLERASYYSVTTGRPADVSNLVQRMATSLQVMLASLDGLDVEQLIVAEGHLSKKIKEFEEITNQMKERSPIPVTVLPPINKL